jgi:hypothetical protein
VESAALDYTGVVVLQDIGHALLEAKEVLQSLLALHMLARV